MKRWIAAPVVLALALFAYVPAARAATRFFVDDNSCPTGIGTQADPFCTITDAVTAAADGDTIIVRPGEYTETVVVNKSLNIRGAQAGRNANKQRHTAKNESTLDAAAGAFHLQDDNITINGFTIEWTTDTSITSLGAGIKTDPAHSGYRIVNNIIRDNIMGIFLNSNATTPSVVGQNRFQANNEPGSGSGTAIDSEEGLHQVTIRSNTFLGNSGAAVLVADTVNPNSNITITHNRANSPILLYNTSASSVTKNNLGNNNGSAVFLGGGDQNVAINANMILAPIFSGVRLADNPTTANSAITIAGNRIAGAGFYGIHIGLTSLTSGTVRGNVVRGSDPDGIFTEGGNAGITFQNNIVRGSKTTDINDDTSGGGTAGTDNTYTNNKCGTSDPTGLCT